MYAYVFEGKRHDTGDKLGLLEATVEFALKRPDLGDSFRHYLRTIERGCGALQESMQCFRFVEMHFPA
jgi:UTP-glucose-1-phosphate uridylyltransferase